MKQIVFALVLLLAGCVVQSFHPFCTDKSVTDATPLSGTWKLQQYCGSDVASSNIYPWVFSGDSLQTFDKENRGATFAIKLFKLGDNLFLDVTPKNLDDNGGAPNELWLFTVRPTHTVCKVAIVKDTLTLKPIAFGWFKEQVEKGAVTLPFMGKLDGLPLFTASAEQWETVLNKYATDTNAFPDKLAFVLVKQPGSK